MNISRLIVGYIYDPFIVWAIFFSILINLAFISAIEDFVKWILESQIYLVIFTTSFVFSYFRQTYPLYKKIKDIKKAKLHDKWVVPRIMSDKVVLDMLLWLGGGVLFFAELMMSFGALDHNAIANKMTYSQLESELPILGFVCIPLISTYYNMRLDNYLKKLEIKLEKINSETIGPLLIMTFFMTLSYVATQNFFAHY
ncbi:MAG: hypothetical protein WBV92_09080 [Nitrosotalea sp.]